MDTVDTANVIFDWNKATDDELTSVLPILLPGFDPSEFTPRGLRKRISIKSKGKGPVEILATYAERITKQKTDIKPEITALSLEEVQDILARLGSSVAVSDKYTADDQWKAYRLLDKKIARRGITLDDARLLEKKALTTGARRGRFTMLETALDNISHPLGFPQAVAEFFQRLQATDPKATFGRAESVRPMAVAKLPDMLGNNIMYISLSKEYKLPDAMLKKRTSKAPKVVPTA